jgi:polyisoprenoid-binding protein YceI
MKLKAFFTLATLATLSVAFKFTESSAWTVDKSHAKLGFTVSHLMVSDVEGWFKTFDANITATNEDFSDAVVEMTADVATINTEDENRDKHLKTADFFDVPKFPTLTFKSSSFKKVDALNYKVKGNLTMHGITKPIELNATAKIGTNPMSKKTIAGFKITGLINRNDFGLGVAIPGAIVGEDVSIVANVEFVKK